MTQRLIKFVHIDLIELCRKLVDMNKASFRTRRRVQRDNNNTCLSYSEFINGKEQATSVEKDKNE